VELKDNPVIEFLIQVVLITSIILIFGEIIPKIYSVSKALKIALLVTPVFKYLIKFLSPFSALLVRSSGIIDKRVSLIRRSITGH
jgi:putative hemolysin